MKNDNENGKTTNNRTGSWLSQYFVFEKEIMKHYRIENAKKDDVESYANELGKEILKVFGNADTTFVPFDKSFGDSKDHFTLLFHIHHDDLVKSMNNYRHWTYANDILKFSEKLNTKKLYNLTKKEIEDEENGVKELNDDEQYHCRICEVGQVADGLKDNFELTDYQALQISVQIQNNKMLENIGSAIWAKLTDRHDGEK